MQRNRKNTKGWILTQGNVAPNLTLTNFSYMWVHLASKVDHESDFDVDILNTKWALKTFASEQKIYIKLVSKKKKSTSVMVNRVNRSLYWIGHFYSIVKNPVLRIKTTMWFRK